MSLTPREAFRFGFLLRCAEVGLSAADGEQLITQHLQKQAGWLGTAGKAIGTAGAAGLGLAAVGGMGAGYLGAKMTENVMDPEEAKKRELIAAYMQQTDYAKRMAARTKYRLGQRSPLRPPKLLN
jgi:hypothetical protein